MAVTLLGASPLPERGLKPEDELREALRAIDAFDFVRGKALLLDLVARSPPEKVAGTAHLHLGILALNDLDSALATREFTAALRADVLCELPANQSPKAQLLFARVRRELLSQPTSSPPAEAAAAPTRSPSLLSAPEPILVEAAPETRSHALGITCGVIGVAMLALTVVSVAEVLSYDGTYGGGLSKPTRYDPGAFSAAQTFEILEFVAGGLTLASGTAAVLTW